MDWVEVGLAWGARATDWAYLAEPYARTANDALFDRTGVGPGTELFRQSHFTSTLSKRSLAPLT